MASQATVEFGGIGEVGAQGRRGNTGGGVHRCGHFGLESGDGQVEFGAQGLAAFSVKDAPVDAGRPGDRRLPGINRTPTDRRSPANRGGRPAWSRCNGRRRRSGQIVDLRRPPGRSNGGQRTAIVRLQKPVDPVCNRSTGRAEAK